ncbi:hypothetical protein HHL11_23055 [Ramlibacter sp. G-1-2-2]|uniref:HEPN AbiU2-like domain-containing protein n=1 Tax=Ramlibacter agri TaxID=2728837 RepID=A0A848HDM7_9BURK|nr:hypothetical protein [Ramlibacter agri]NML46643.1 hypothetical protein [Ramlibacter agri]
MTERTAQESKVANITAMGDALGSIYSELWQEVAWIHQRWAHFVELFGTKPERIDLMNQAAPPLFRTVQDTLFEAVLLHLARLTDPSKNVLSLRRVVKLTTGTPIGKEVAKLVQEAIAATEFARDWRNRKLAHRDLQLALGGRAQTLAPASRADVKTALKAVVDVLNAISAHYLDSTTGFHLGPGGADALGLLLILRDGLRFEEQRMERLRKGVFSPEDLKHEAI